MRVGVGRDDFVDGFRRISLRHSLPYSRQRPGKTAKAQIAVQIAVKGSGMSMTYRRRNRIEAQWPHLPQGVAPIGPYA